ncbi:MAG TPA: DEAD/DEAH box helicase [Gammaproteobacteria bacterium]|jgi:ATP-dependent RNA helicase RhlE|nr:DEAD/DEAH box helicase [Gammaproteobacteria bacterium]
MSFSSLGLSAELLRAVTEQGYTEPTPVQTQAIPVILTGRDLQAAAQTGTGKTAGFTLPLLQRLQAAPVPQAHKRPVRVLILTPTRELAAQVGESVQTYGKYLRFQCVTIFGGVNINPQIDKLRRGVDIVIATPGRLLDHVEQRTIDLSRVEILVLDEADRMLDMGFIRDIRRILTLLPSGRQNLMFSATFSDDIRKLAGGILRDPATIDVAPRNSTAERVSQRVYPVDQHRKRALLAQLIKEGDWKQVLVFTRTKHGANRLCEQLSKEGIQSAAIHGNKSQGARTRALADFKDNRVRVLVATDIAARGLDIDQLPHVVNYELPNVPEDYVHRIGRTGRAGSSGEAVSLVAGSERSLLRDIERLLRQEIPQTIVPGFEPGSGPAPEAEPRQAHGHAPRRSQGGGNHWHNRSGSRSQGRGNGRQRSSGSGNR